MTLVIGLESFFLRSGSESVLVVEVVCIGQLVYCRPFAVWWLQPIKCDIGESSTEGIIIRNFTCWAVLLCCWVTTVINQSKLPIFKPSLCGHAQRGMVPAQ